MSIKITLKIDKDENNIPYILDRGFLVKEFFQKENYLTELKHSLFLNKYNIGPRIIRNCETDTNWFIMYEKWDGTLNDVLQSHFGHIPTKNDIIESVGKELEIIHKNNFFHNQVMPKNILYKLVNNKYFFTLTNFDKISTHENKKMADDMMFKKILNTIEKRNKIKEKDAQIEDKIEDDDEYKIENCNNTRDTIDENDIKILEIIEYDKKREFFHYIREKFNNMKEAVKSL